MRPTYARRGKHAVVREPRCPLSREKRSLCRHCVLNPLVPSHPDVTVTALFTAVGAARCALDSSHPVAVGSEVGLAMFVGRGFPERVGWVCEFCVAGLPFEPRVEAAA